MKKLPISAPINVLWFLILANGIACKPQDDQQSAALGVTRSISWEQLKVGQRFRMSPPNQTSKCYLPGNSGLSTGNCGDQEYWVVTKAHNPYIKQIKSLINHKCLEFADGKLRSANCTTDRSQPVKNARGDEDLSPLQKQYLSLADGSLAPAFRRDCSAVNRTVGNCKVLADSTKATGRSAPVEFYVDDERGSPGSTLIYRSEPKGRSEGSNESFASEITMGRLPRITAMYVATNEAYVGNAQNSYITGIQIHFSDGSKQLIGACHKDPRDNCKVNTSDRSGYPNPKIFTKDEYITNVAMKFSGRLVELMIKTNKHPQRPILWKGLGDGKAQWQWLTAKKDTMIAGFFGTLNSGAVKDPYGFAIKSMGVIYAHLDTYKAHNPDAFQKVSSKAKKINALAEKDGKNIIGLTAANSSSPDYRTQSKARNELFQDPQYQFSSTFYAGAMGNSSRTSSVRMYFTRSILSAIVVHPEGVNGAVQPEIYGSIPQGQSPNLYLELAPGEYIKRINWHSFNYNIPFGSIESFDIHGPLIYGIQLVTSRGRTAQYSSFDTNSRPWQYAMGKDGYAIVGFHGISSDGEAGNNLKIGSVIVNLGAWLVKTSELPDVADKGKQESVSSNSRACPAKTFRNRSDATFVEFRLPSSAAAKTNTINISSGSYHKYVVPKCNRVWWTNLTFICRDGAWTRDSGDWNADALCYGDYDGASPYVHVGDL